MALVEQAVVVVGDVAAVARIVAGEMETRAVHHRVHGEIVMLGVVVVVVCCCGVVVVVEMGGGAGGIAAGARVERRVTGGRGRGGRRGRGRVGRDERAVGE